ncbi:MAG: sigma factor [Bacillota bacterium]
MTGATLDPDSRDIEACLRGEGQAFAGLVLRHQQGAMRLAWHLLGHRPAAEDAVQAAFLRAWRALPGPEATRQLPELASQDHREPVP